MADPGYTPYRLSESSTMTLANNPLQSLIEGAVVSA